MAATFFLDGPAGDQFGSDSGPVGIVAAAIAIGVVLGALAGFVPRLDQPLMRITDVFLSVPNLVLAMAIAAVLGRSIANLSIALVFVWWPIYCRLMRGQVLSEKKKPYVKALRPTLGVGRLRMIFRHVIPNAIFPVVARAAADVGLVLITMAALSYIGFGPGPYVPEWGSLIASGQAYIFQAPWLVYFPGAAIFLTSLSLNLVGDWARDAFESPRLRGLNGDGCGPRGRPGCRSRVEDIALRRAQHRRQAGARPGQYQPDGVRRRDARPGR